MFQIFNGSTRGLGANPQLEIYCRIGVGFRKYLHYLKGSRLHVFISIALRADESGWSDPTLSEIRSDTGYDPTTISETLTELCEVKIEDSRILFAIQERTKGKFDNNAYLIFPTAEEMLKYKDVERKPRGGRPSRGKPYTVSPNTEDTIVLNTNTEEGIKDSLSPKAKTGSQGKKKAAPKNDDLPPLSPKNRRERKPNHLMDMVATFCFKADTREEINANAGRIAKSEVVGELRDYLNVLYKIPEGEELSEDDQQKVADAVIHGRDGLMDMGAWWDTTYMQADGKPINRPNPLKFMSAFIDFVKWRRGELNKPKIVRKNGDEFYDERGSWMKMEDDKIWRYKGGEWVEAS